MAHGNLIRVSKLGLAVLVAAVILSGLDRARAQSIAIGTSAQGTATYQIGAALAKVAGETAGLKAVIQPQGGTGKVVPLVNAGRVDFGLANILEVTNGIKGRGPFKGRPHPNLRVVGVLYPFRVGFFVRKDHAAKSVKDIKGLRIASEYKGQRIIHILASAILKNAGIKWEEMSRVPAVNIIAAMNDFSAGKLDVGFFVVGAGKVRQIDAAVGGVRFLSIDSGDDAVKAMRTIVPPAYALEVRPRKGLTGVTQPVHLMTFDYLLYAGKHVANDNVYKVAKMIAEQKAALAAAMPAFRGSSRDKLAKNIGLEFHPGAVKYYQEQGLWKR